jgi:zinc protease
VIGAYNCTFSERSLFVYRCRTDCQGYYIRKNVEPKNRAELRLVVNAGSTLETEKQRGLAHFVEHMCFNGTKNFKKQELVDFLEKSGVNFGADLNAYTSFDETVYELQVPTDSPMVYKKPCRF